MISENIPFYPRQMIYEWNYSDTEHAEQMLRHRNRQIDLDRSGES